MRKRKLCRCILQFFPCRPCALSERNADGKITACKMNAFESVQAIYIVGLSA